MLAQIAKSRALFLSFFCLNIIDGVIFRVLATSGRSLYGRIDDSFMMMRGGDDVGLVELRSRRLALLFGLHAPVLEPDFDLALRQAEGVCDLDSPASSQVPIEVELLLQLERLIARVRLASPFRIRHHVCKAKKKVDMYLSMFSNFTGSDRR